MCKERRTEAHLGRQCPTSNALRAQCTGSSHEEVSHTTWCRAVVFEDHADGPVADFRRSRTREQRPSQGAQLRAHQTQVRVPPRSMAFRVCNRYGWDKSHQRNRPGSAASSEEHSARAASSPAAQAAQCGSARRVLSDQTSEKGRISSGSSPVLGLHGVRRRSPGTRPPPGRYQGSQAWRLQSSRNHSECSHCGGAPVQAR